MKNHRIALFLFTLLTACGAATTAGHQSPKFAFAMRDVQFPMRDFRFPSGLRVIVEEDHRIGGAGLPHRLNDSYHIAASNGGYVASTVASRPAGCRTSASMLWRGVQLGSHPLARSRVCTGGNIERSDHWD